MLINFCFGVFSFGLVSSLLMSVFSRQSVQAVLWLVVGFFSAAWIYLLLSAQFIAMLLIIVYVGAIATLFLFVVMMLEQKKERAPRFFPTLTAALIIIFAIAIFAKKTFINIAFNANAAYSSFITDKSSDVLNLGLVLYTKYFVIFQLCGLVLFTTMVGIIFLIASSGAMQKSNFEKRQNISQQVLRKKEDSLEVVRGIKTGHGVKTN